MSRDNRALVQAFLDENAKSIDSTLETFQESAQLFSSNKPRLVDEYENKWVAAHDGAIVAVADSLEDVMAMVCNVGIRPSETMIRHIDRDEKTLIM